MYFSIESDISYTILDFYSTGIPDMSNYYETTNQKGLLLYTQEHEIFLRHKVSHNFLQPLMIAEDYQSQLKDLVFNSTIYYSYINTSGNIMLRSIMEQVFPMEIAREDATEILQSLPSVCFGNLFLFYVTYHQTEHTYLVRGLLPYQGQKELSLPQCRFSSQPHLQVVPYKTELLLFCRDESGLRIFQITDSLRILDLSSEQEQLQKQLDQLHKTVGQKEKDISELSQKLSHTEHEIARLKHVIESVSVQYEELMHVAQAYKEEAVKWRSKYTGR